MLDDWRDRGEYKASLHTQLKIQWGLQQYIPADNAQAVLEVSAVSCGHTGGINSGRVEGPAQGCNIWIFFCYCAHPACGELHPACDAAVITMSELSPTFSVPTVIINH